MLLCLTMSHMDLLRDAPPTLTPDLTTLQPGFTCTCSEQDPFSLLLNGRGLPWPHRQTQGRLHRSLAAPLVCPKRRVAFLSGTVPERVGLRPHPAWIKSAHAEIHGGNERVVPATFSAMDGVMLFILSLS